MLRHLLYALRCVEPAECFAKAKLIRGCRPDHKTMKKRPNKSPVIFHGWDGGIRTPECQDQNLVPYHLATAQYKPEINSRIINLGIRVTFGDPASQSDEHSSFVTFPCGLPQAVLTFACLVCPFIGEFIALVSYVPTHPR